MPQYFIRKLGRFTRLSAGDRRALEAASGRQRSFGPREDIVREGDGPTHVNLILDGWACRYKQLADGRRQITSFFVPGDVCEDHVYVLREMDHSIGTLTPARVAEMPRPVVERMTAEHPRVGEAMRWEHLVTAAIQREWTVSLGQRSASERLGHLLCEVFLRLQSVGLAEGNSCPLPLTQMEMADAMGQSAVHINRTLQELRGSGLIVLKGRRLTIPDLGALQAASLFNPGYLHLDREGSHLDANEPDGP